ncbi:unnamed protein product [Closterium sp. NIES-65]|nr:unnamed protein product [Closterium sp. NIES-65]
MAPIAAATSARSPALRGDTPASAPAASPRAGVSESATNGRDYSEYGAEGMWGAEAEDKGLNEGDELKKGFGKSENVEVEATLEELEQSLADLEETINEDKTKSIGRLDAAEAELAQRESLGIGSDGQYDFGDSSSWGAAGGEEVKGGVGGKGRKNVGAAGGEGRGGGEEREVEQTENGMGEGGRRGGGECKLFTFFDPSQVAGDVEQEASLLHVWQLSWLKAGWVPVVLRGEESIKEHGEYNEMLTRAVEGAGGVAMKPIVTRWLAVAAAGGGLFAHYDVINFGVPPPANCLIGPLSTYGDLFPFMLSGQPDDFARLAQARLPLPMQAAHPAPSITGVVSPRFRFPAVRGIVRCSPAALPLFLQPPILQNLYPGMPVPAGISNLEFLHALTHHLQSLPVNQEDSTTDNRLSRAVSRVLNIPLTAAPLAVETQKQTVAVARYDMAGDVVTVLQAALGFRIGRGEGEALENAVRAGWEATRPFASHVHGEVLDTILGRNLVDVRLLQAAGVRVDEALARAKVLDG